MAKISVLDTDITVVKQSQEDCISSSNFNYGEFAMFSKTMGFCNSRVESRL